MGNCLRRESSMVWAEDEWDSSAPAGQKIILYDAGSDYSDQVRNVNVEESQRFLGEEGNSSGSNYTEVKIKISKRELEELMARVDMQGLTMEELLAKLLNSSEDYHQQLLMEHDDHHRRSWRPALQSIPE